jgi:hypothetical protein
VTSIVVNEVIGERREMRLISQSGGLRRRSITLWHVDHDSRIVRISLWTSGEAAT